MSTAIPSLHNGPIDVLVDRQKKLWTLIVFIFSNPGSISNVMEHELISFRKLDAEFGLRRLQMASELERHLAEAVDRLFPGDNLSVGVVAEDVDEVRYILKIIITDGTEVALAAPMEILNGKVQVTDWNMVI